MLTPDSIYLAYTFEVTGHAKLLNIAALHVQKSVTC
jgi:hypothetical protein